MKLSHLQSHTTPLRYQCLCKVWRKLVKEGTRAQKRSAKHFRHTSRAITLLFQNEISPLAIPYHSSPIPMSMQSLKKISQKVLNLEHGNAVTDRRMNGRRTDGHSKFGGYNIIPHHFCVAGYKNKHIKEKTGYDEKKNINELQINK